jgi:uncharacterized protein YeaO (DUF488 family)
MAMANLRIKRIYELPEPGDGFRILVDRVWPRGVTKEKAAIDLWMREIAPSAELRKWFGHAPERWAEFRKRYQKELEGKVDRIAELRRQAAKGPLTFVYSARDEERNQAVVIKEMMEKG